MAVIAVVTSSPPGAEGGHLVIARSLVQAARDVGHDAHLVVTPDFGFGRTMATYRAALDVDLAREIGRPVNQVISLRYPSYAVRHPLHVSWLNHTMREYYDLWPRFSASISWRNRIKETVRKHTIHLVDRFLLKRLGHNVVAQSRTIASRLRTDFGIRADVLHPPAPQRDYRCDEYGSFIFAPSRLTPLKRIDLLIRALAEPLARRIEVIVAGEGECRAELEAQARSLGVDPRVRFVGRLDDGGMVGYLAKCRAVCFAPYAEDYGFVTVEAFASAKPVITCEDSGGPTDLVIHEETGLVCEPTPSSLAKALARLADDRQLAEDLGARAVRQSMAMSWSAAVDRLVII